MLVIGCRFNVFQQCNYICTTKCQTFTMPDINISSEKLKMHDLWQARYLAQAQKKGLYFLTFKDCNFRV